MMDPLMRLAINLMKLDLAAGLSSGEDLDRDRDERNLNSESTFGRPIIYRCYIKHSRMS